MSECRVLLHGVLTDVLHCRARYFVDYREFNEEKNYNQKECRDGNVLFFEYLGCGVRKNYKEI